MKEGLEIIRFDGKITFPDGAISRFSVAGSFRAVDFTNIRLEIFWHGDDAERRRALGSFMANQMNHVWIPNENPAAGHVELLGLAGFSTEFVGTSPISTEPQFFALQKGIHRSAETEDRRFYVNVRLAPSGLFANGIYERHYTGEIKVTPLADHSPIQIQTEFGELLVSDTFEYESVEEFGNKVTKQISKSTITGEISVPKGASLYDVNEKLKKELDFVRIALSLCYRQPVRHVSITYLDLEKKQRRPPAYYRRKMPEVKAKLKVDEFINARNLGNGGLQRIINALKTIVNSADLIRAIDFLAASYESTVETAFFMAFSAMETVVNLAAGSVEGAGYSKAQWKSIRKALEEAIGKAAGELSLDSADLIEKLPELKRLSFRKRVTLACSALNPETADLWPGRDFIEGISEAAKIRNGLFHSAEYSNGASISDSLIRIRTFAERLIAKLIKWPVEELWVWRDQDLRFLNRGPQPENVPGAKDSA